MNSLFRKLIMAALVATLSTTAFAASSKGDGDHGGKGGGYSGGSASGQGLAPESLTVKYSHPTHVKTDDYYLRPKIKDYFPVRRVVDKKGTTCDPYYNAITQNNMTVTVPIYNECLRRGGY